MSDDVACCSEAPFLPVGERCVAPSAQEKKEIQEWKPTVD